MTGPAGSAGPARLPEIERRLQATEAELALARTQLAKVQASSAYRLGLALVSAARRPRRAAVSLPRDVLQIYRSRRSPQLRPGSAPGGGGATGAPSAPRGPARAPAAPADLLGDHVAAAFSAQLAPRETVAVAGILHPATARVLAGEVRLTALLPDGAPQLLERVGADLVLVDATATGTGAWAGLGTYLSPSLERRLAQVLAAARDLGIPTVLWDPLGAARVPALHEVVEFDLVLDGSWSPGVRMAHCYAVPDAPRPIEVLAVGDTTEMADGLVAELAGLLPDGLRVAAADGDVPAALLGAALDVHPRDQHLWSQARLVLPLESLPLPSTPAAPGGLAGDVVAASLTAGARVVVAVAPPGLEPFVHVTGQAAPLPDVVRSVLASEPMPAATHLAALGAVYARHSAHRRVLDLLDRAQVAAPPQLAGRRRVSVLTSQPSGPVDVGALVEAWSAQTEPPAEIVVVVPGGADAAGSAATAGAAGLEVRLVPEVPGRPWWIQAARVATHDLVTVASRPPAVPDALLTLLALREATDADAVALDTLPQGAHGQPRAVGQLALDGALLRREMLLAAVAHDGGLAAQTVHRGRLVAASAPDPAGRAAT